MTKQVINVGTTANDKKGDSLRAAFQKVNANFTELYTAAAIPGPFTDDEAAASEGVAVGSPYYRNNGQVFVRLA